MVVAPSTYRLSMLGSFAFQIDDEPIALPKMGERVVAFLAIAGRPVSRARLAGALWPEVTEERSQGSLRSALWRLRSFANGLVESRDGGLQLSGQAQLDTVELTRFLRRLSDPEPPDLCSLDPAAMSNELLPGWYDDWVVFERERLRQLVLSGLEVLSRRQTAAGRLADAVQSAWAAVSLEPFRESAHAALIDAHLAQGNLSEAVQRLRAFDDMLRAELGVGAGPDLRARVEAAISARR